MVRRAGASKACLTCLKRKKGCDQQRPSCGQCRGACIECLGYTRPLKFRNTTTTTTEKPPELSTRPTRSGTTPETLIITAYQTKLIGSYWESYLPNGQALPAEVTSVGGWIQSVQDLVTHEGLVRKGLIALSLAMHGRVQGEQWMSQEGQRLYGDALHDLAASMKTRRLGKDRGQESLRLVTTVRLLSFFEVIQNPQNDDGNAQVRNWMVHNVGEAALLTSNAPEFYVSGRAHRIFVDGRINLACAALRARKRTFLGETKWKKIPWTVNPKTPRDHLVDIFVDLPSLIENMDDLMLLKESRTSNSITQLCNQCLDLHRRLLQWYFKYHTDPDLDENPTHQNTSIKPYTLLTAHLSTLYHSILIKVYEILYLLDPTDEILPTRSLSTLSCRSIIRTLPILLSPAVGMFRLHLASFPLTTVVRFLAMTEPLEEERIEVAEFLRRKECVTMRRFIGSMQPENMGRVLGEGIRGGGDMSKLIPLCE